MNITVEWLDGWNMEKIRQHYSDPLGYSDIFSEKHSRSMWGWKVSSAFIDYRELRLGATIKPERPDLRFRACSPSAVHLSTVPCNTQFMRRKDRRRFVFLVATKTAEDLGLKYIGRKFIAHEYTVYAKIDLGHPFSRDRINLMEPELRKALAEGKGN